MNRQNKFIAGIVALSVLLVLVSLFFPNSPLDVLKRLRGETGKPVRITASPTLTPVPIALQTGPFRCPSQQDFCLIGKDVIKEGVYVGWGAAVPINYPVIAAFDGDVSSAVVTLPNKEEFTTLYLDNKERQLRATYYFKGEPPENERVSEGKYLGSVGEPIAFYDNMSLIFSLTKGDFVRGERVKLTLNDFMQVPTPPEGTLPPSQ